MIVSQRTLGSNIFVRRLSLRVEKRKTLCRDVSEQSYFWELGAVATKAPPPNLGCTELEHELLVGDEEQRPQSVRPEMPVRRRQ